MSSGLYRPGRIRWAAYPGLQPGLSHLGLSAPRIRPRTDVCALTSLVFDTAFQPRQGRHVCRTGDKLILKLRQERHRRATAIQATAPELFMAWRIPRTWRSFTSRRAPTA